MHALTHTVRQPADGQDISGAVKGERIVAVQTLMGKDFIFDGIKPMIVTIKTMARKRLALQWLHAWHCFDHTAPMRRKSQAARSSAKSQLLRFLGSNLSSRLSLTMGEGPRVRGERLSFAKSAKKQTASHSAVLLRAQPN